MNSRPRKQVRFDDKKLNEDDTIEVVELKSQDVLKLGLDTITQLSAIGMCIVFLSDFFDRGLGTNNGRFISFCDSLDSCVSFRNRLPPAPAPDCEVVAQPLSTQQASAQVPDGEEERERYRRLSWTKRQGSVFAMRSNKNSTWWIIYVALATLLLKFLGGTIISYVVHRTPVLFQGLRHYLTFLAAVLIVQFSPQDAVYKTLSRNAFHRLVMGLGMSLYKYRKVMFAVLTGLENQYTMAEVILVGTLVIELNSLIRNAERYLTHWPLITCLRCAPMGLINSLVTTKTAFSVFSTAGILLSALTKERIVRQEDGSKGLQFIHGFLTFLAMFFMILRYNYSFGMYLIRWKVQPFIRSVGSPTFQHVLDLVSAIQLKDRLLGLPHAIVYAVGMVLESIIDSPKSFKKWRSANIEAQEESRNTFKYWLKSWCVVSLSARESNRWILRVVHLLAIAMYPKVDFISTSFLCFYPWLIVMGSKHECSNHSTFWKRCIFHVELLCALYMVEVALFSNLLHSFLYRIGRASFVMWLSDPESQGMQECTKRFRRAEVTDSKSTQPGVKLKEN